MSLHIAIDAAELEGSPTGVGRYLERLLHTWLAEPGEEQFTLLHGGDVQVPLPQNSRLRNHAIASGLLSKPLWWQQVELPKELRRVKPDLLFAPAYVKPLRWRGPTVLTIHDLSYEAQPQWFSPLHGQRMRWFTRRSARDARAIIAVSEFTRGEIVERYGIEPERVHTVHHGIDNSLAEAPYTPEKELRTAIDMHRPFVLSVGTIFERRFPIEMIAAFRDLDIGLVIVGDDRRRNPGDIDARIAEFGLADRVRWLRYSNQTDVLGLYRSAEALIYLSAYEGFGLPPLEGMSLGLPAIVSNRGALREIYADSACLVEDETPEAIADAVRRVVNESEFRDGLVNRGAELVARMTLQRCAERTLSILRAAGDAI